MNENWKSGMTYLNFTNFLKNFGRGPDPPGRPPLDPPLSLDDYCLYEPSKGVHKMCNRGVGGALF